MYHDLLGSFFTRAGSKPVQQDASAAWQVFFISPGSWTVITPFLAFRGRQGGPKLLYPSLAWSGKAN